MTEYLRTICADLSYSKKLKEWFPNSEWWLFEHCSKCHQDYENQEIEFRYSLQNKKDFDWGLNKDPCYPVLLTDDLLGKLPKQIEYHADTDYYSELVVTWDTKIEKWTVYYSLTQKCPIGSSDQKLANALCKMLLWLIDKGYVRKGE